MFEADDTSPIFTYGESKLSCEALSKRYYKNNFHAVDKKLTIGRIFNAVGEHETTEHIVPALIKRMSASKNGTIEVGNLFPKRDFVNVKSIAKKIIEAVHCTKTVMTVNIGSGETISIQELIDMVSRAMNRHFELRVNKSFVRNVERECLKPDCSIMTALTGSPCEAVDQNFINNLVRSKFLMQ